MTENEAIQRCIEVVNSCNTKVQVMYAKKYIRLFNKKVNFNTDTLYYLLDLATDKGIKGLLAQHGRAIG